MINCSLLAYCRAVASLDFWKLSGIIVTCRSALAINQSLVCFTTAVARIPDAQITLVPPLHQPGSANVAASVCLYREQERPLRSVRPRPTVDLGFPVPGGSVHKQIVTTTAHWMMWFFGIIGGNLYSLIFATNNWLFYVAIRKQM